VEEQRPGQHPEAVHRQGRSFPGGQDIRVDGELHVQKAVGQESDQLRRRMDETRIGPEHAGQVITKYPVRDAHIAKMRLNIDIICNNMIVAWVYRYNNNIIVTPRTRLVSDERNWFCS